MNTIMTPLVFVWLGNTLLPFYALVSLYTNRYMNKGMPIYIIVDNRTLFVILDLCLIGISCIYIKDVYHSTSNRPKSRSSNFWYHAANRFHYLAAFAEKYNISCFWHAELDNVCFDLEMAQKTLLSRPKSVYIPRESNSRVIASTIFVSSLEALFAISNALNKDNFSAFNNEMVALHRLSLSCDFIQSLPTLTSYLTFKDNEKDVNQPISSLYDAASIGQFVYGSFSHYRLFPILPYVNPDAVYKIDTLSIRYINRSCYIKLPEGQFRLHNIHIHTKSFLVFLLDYINLKLPCSLKRVLSIRPSAMIYKLYGIYLHWRK